ncbi:hypothetical protein BB560_002525 [Smittium megazygosporum]|uniref:Checkpoint protein RAD24-like helical bundle domain-containing protein n=1 Tax=Smittium megazygosporum TaxID=133381 RepID=A0A2T9ZEJ3_9FUNG|nr:hypothetical protein BB560_002525 [Smittium megazygosporum]
MSQKRPRLILSKTPVEKSSNIVSSQSRSSRSTRKATPALRLEKIKQDDFIELISSDESEDLDLLDSDENRFSDSNYESELTQSSSKPPPKNRNKNIYPDTLSATSINTSCVNSSIWWAELKPTSRDALAVHPKKVDQVYDWIEKAVNHPNIFKNNRILVLSGPAGSGKTATVKLIASSLNCNILEWVNPTYSSSDLKNFDIKSSNNDIRVSQQFSYFLQQAKTKNLLSRIPSNTHVFLIQASNSQLNDFEDSNDKTNYNLSLFHALGKVLYAKRKPSTSGRGTLSSNPNYILQNIPLDLNTFQLYLYENYPPFTEKIEEFEKVAEYFSDWDLFNQSASPQHYSQLSSVSALLPVISLMELRESIPKRIQGGSFFDFINYLPKINPSKSKLHPQLSEYDVQRLSTLYSFGPGSVDYFINSCVPSIKNQGSSASDFRFSENKSLINDADLEFESLNDDIEYSSD